MKENLELIKNVIRHPGRTVEVLKDKPMGLGIVLLIINIVVSGALFGYSKFWMPPGSLLFWVFAPLVGLLFAIFLGVFQGLYYSISKFVLKEKENIGLKILTGYFLIVFSLYHIVAAAVITIAIPLHEYWVAIIFWDVSHVILLFWIAALCVQAIQKIREETEFRTMLKVFISLFGAYCIQMIVFIVLSTNIISLIYR